MDSMSLAPPDGAAPLSAVQILARRRQSEAATAMPVPFVAAIPAPATSKGPKPPKTHKIHKKIPASLGLDRRLTIKAHSGGSSDGTTWVRPGFIVTVPPGISTGQTWHFRVEVGVPDQEWRVIETLKIDQVDDAGALPGAGTVFECVSRAVLRAGLDRASKQVGFVERGDQLVCLETRLYGGRTRVRFERGWTSARSGSGKVLLRQVRSVVFGQRERVHRNDDVVGVSARSWKASLRGCRRRRRQRTGPSLGYSCRAIARN